MTLRGDGSKRLAAKRLRRGKIDGVKRCIHGELEENSSVMI